MNIKLFGLCPECFNKEVIIINEAYIYCSKCGLELETPEPVFNKEQFNKNYFKDLERYKKRFEE